MDRRLKISICLMISAVVLVPVAILLKNISETAMLIVLIFTMLLELIGLIFVIMHVIKERKL